LLTRINSVIGRGKCPDVSESDACPLLRRTDRASPAVWYADGLMGVIRPVVYEGSLACVPGALERLPAITAVLAR
jgi:hypothetical protein